MARKSRNNIINFSDSFKKNSASISTVPEQKNEQIRKIPTAIYARLSYEDNGYDGGSIEMQIAYIHRYIMEHDEYSLVETYIDNGYSGSNFNRPDFNRLISDVYSGKIECIVVKDLSRFGRNYLEVGFYIENILPKKNARLVSINDHFDSSKEEDRNSLSVPIKNMINEMYARDLSKKIKAANDIRAQNRNSKHRSCPPYGYKDNEDCTDLIVDERYAPYVKLIFQWFLIGVNVIEITERLNLIGAPIPAIATNKRNIDKFENKWLPSKVYNILNNPLYTGDKILNRFEVNRFGGYTRKRKPEQWIVHKNTHEPLVSRDDYELVKEKKKVMSDNTIFYDDSLENRFRGLIYCANCNRRMEFARIGYDSNSKDYTHSYYCCNPREYHSESCGNRVSSDLIVMIVDEQLKMYIKMLSEKADMLKNLKDNYGNYDAGLPLDEEIKALEKRRNDIREKNSRLYEDFSSGLIDENDYKLLRKKTSDNDFDIDKKLEQLYGLKDEQNRKIYSFLEIVDDISPKNTGGDGVSFDSDLIHKLIEKIYVGQDNRIEIIFKFNGIFEEIDRIMESDS